MLCSEKCPKGTECEPLSNIISNDNSSLVCIGLHNEKKEKYPSDKFRHCFKSEDTDSSFDYDEYDLKSVIAVISEAILIEELAK